jgi:phosphoenolpyruvate phosphomutase
MDKYNLNQSICNSLRRGSLKHLLATKGCVRVMEAHNPLSAIIVENAKVFSEASNETLSYDAFWSSSLTDSTERGKPDIEALNIRNRISNINDIFEVTSKPLIIDGDTGRTAEHFAIDVRTLERLGVSAVIIEDKTGLKRNSLLGNSVLQLQEHVEVFCRKIAAGKRAQLTDDFMVIARIESLILDAGMEDALHRANAYIEAGVDGIMIHSRMKNHQEIVEFAREFRKLHPAVPLVAVPTSYSQIYFEDLRRAGFNIVIYANHMLRASHAAMQSVALNILKHDRSLEAEMECTDVDEILKLIPVTV